MTSWADHEAWRHAPVSVEVVTAATAVAALSLDDLRAQVSQPLPDDDRLLLRYLEAAQRVIETRIARPLFPQTRRAWFDGVPGAVVRLSEPATAIVSVTGYSPTDVATTVAPTVYQADVTTVPARLLLRQGQAWPTALRARQAYAVTYTTGWSVADMPESLRLAIALLVAHYYEHRTAAQAGTLTDLPFGIDALIQPHTSALGVA